MTLPLTVPPPTLARPTVDSEIMRRIPRSIWMEWLDALVMSGPVTILPSEGDVRSEWTLQFVDYDPFDHVIELMIADGSGSLRMLIDRPTEILAAGPTQSPDHVTILADDGPIIIRRLAAWTHPGASEGSG